LGGFCKIENIERYCQHERRIWFSKHYSTKIRKESEGTHLGPFYPNIHKNFKFSKNHNFFLPTIPILFLQNNQ